MKYTVTADSLNFMTMVSDSIVYALWTQHNLLKVKNYTIVWCEQDEGHLCKVRLYAYYNTLI